MERGFDEVADRVWVARYEWCDANVTMIEGERGLVVVDTHASLSAGRRVLADVRSVSARPVVAVVNTHAHFDHVFGNAAFREHGPVPIYAHESAALETISAGERAKAASAADTGADTGAASADEAGLAATRSRELAATPLVAADVTFSSVAAIELGDRTLELVHPGRGHTAGDLVVRVEDADVLLAGDLVEESGVPAYGEDCFPMEWPTSLDLVLQLVGPATVVVPGHGAPVDRGFVMEQRSSIGVVAETIRDLASRGVPLSQALDATQWPYPSEGLGEAVRRAYEQLPRDAKRLPLL